MGPNTTPHHTPYWSVKTKSLGICCIRFKGLKGNISTDSHLEQLLKRWPYTQKLVLLWAQKAHLPAYCPLWPDCK